MRRKDTTSEMMKSYIIESLLLLMRKKAYTDISISEITKKAGVNRSTYYRHFSNKDDIIFDFFDNLMKEYIKTIDKKDAHNIEHYLCNLFAFFLNYKEELLLIYKNGLSVIFLEVLNIHLGTATINKPMSEQYKITYHIGGIFNHFLMWFSREMRDSPQELSKVATDLFTNNFTPYLLK